MINHNKLNNEKILKLILSFWLIAQYSFPFFKNDLLLILGFFLSAICFFSYKKKIGSFGFLYLSIFLFVTILQAVKYWYFPLVTNTGLFVRILFAYFTVKFVHNELIDNIIEIMYYLAITSLFFYFISYIPIITQFIINNISPLVTLKGHPHVIIYTFNPGATLGSIYRNSGPLWEPGAFSGFLLISLIFNLIKTKNIFNIRNLLFIISIITTFSTSGLIVLTTTILAYLNYKINDFRKYPLCALILIIGIVGYNTFDFLGLKIKKQYAVLENRPNKIYNHNRSRFVSAYVDIKDIKNNLFVGRGRNVRTMYDKEIQLSHFHTHRTNGLTTFAVKFGIPIWIFYLYSVYYTFKRYCIANQFNKNFAFFAFFAFLLISFSQVYFLRTFFIGLAFLHIPYNPFNKNEITPVKALGKRSNQAIGFL